MQLTKLETEYDLVYVIDTLSPAEREKHKLTEFLTETLAKNNIPVAIARCKSAAQLLQAFSKMLELAQQGKNMCLQIVSHGYDGGLWIGETNEAVIWSDISPILISINISMGGTLLINMTTCDGLYGMKMIDVKNESSPFFGLVGCNRELFIWEAHIINQLLYKKLMDGKDLSVIVPEIQQELINQGSKADAVYSISSEGYRLIIEALKSTK